ncbi:hypothetical protein [Psychromonas aquatilis]|uniref:Uncharacterized protein n=1 Tax=Psychromonas aquatilis TaxID=2005072 RepID=A0ABU9GPR0_9GAMM
MANKNLRQSDSVLENLTGFRPKTFVIVIAVAYMSVLTLPPVIAFLGLPSVPAVIGIMLVQYFLLYYAGQLHGSSLLRTMKDNGFIGWIMWLAVICMLMLPIIHLLSLFGLIN